jgi:hypothetical protein
MVIKAGRGGDGTRAVYKPVCGEDPMAILLQRANEYGPATFADREVAASRLDALFGFHLVPTTTYWSGPAGVGSLQRFAETAGPTR